MNGVPGSGTREGAGIGVDAAVVGRRVLRASVFIVS